MRFERAHRIALAAALALACAGAPLAADWLVTTSGDRVETQGAWKVEGRLVVFTTPDGRLSSMRLADCDLPASEAATAAAARRKAARPPAPEPVAKPVILVLTDADVGHVEPERPAGDAEGDEQDEAPTPVFVDDWIASDEDNGVGITGIVRNTGPNVAGRVRVLATFIDAYGDPIEQRSAVLSTSTLRPGQKAQFRVEPFGLFSYARVRFEVEHFELLSGAAAPADDVDGG